ncbi:MAG: hypothetical protein JRJ03_12605 [Deltaproteobacteria bacterium]|nr:hypothetical protein [Deltaproteobacteria bacterium]
MKIKEEHKELLRRLGLNDDDFKLFDGKYVTYEFHEEKGVRLYDPNYETSYGEYIDIDGWSAWSSEQDTFMSDILKGAREGAERAEKISPGPSEKDIEQTLKAKFGNKDTKDDSETR